MYRQIYTTSKGVVSGHVTRYLRGGGGTSLNELNNNEMDNKIASR